MVGAEQTFKVVCCGVFIGLLVLCAFNKYGSNWPANYKMIVAKGQPIFFWINGLHNLFIRFVPKCRAVSLCGVTWCARPIVDVFYFHSSVFFVRSYCLSLVPPGSRRPGVFAEGFLFVGLRAPFT